MGRLAAAAGLLPWWASARALPGVAAAAAVAGSRHCNLVAAQIQRTAGHTAAHTHKNTISNPLGK